MIPKHYYRWVVFNIEGNLYSAAKKLRVDRGTLRNTLQWVDFQGDTLVKENLSVLFKNTTAAIAESLEEKLMRYVVQSGDMALLDKAGIPALYRHKLINKYGKKYKTNAVH